MKIGLSMQLGCMEWSIGLRAWLRNHRVLEHLLGSQDALIKDYGRSEPNRRNLKPAAER
jgi:hypothetical protein